MASLTLHYSITTVGDNDKAAPELDHSGLDESQARAKEEVVHVRNGGRAHGQQDGVLHAKNKYQHCWWHPVLLSRLCSNAS